MSSALLVILLRNWPRVGGRSPSPFTAAPIRCSKMQFVMYELGARINMMKVCSG